MECAWASPKYLDEMYLDSIDIHGLFWWAQKIHEENEKIKPKK